MARLYFHWLQNYECTSFFQSSETAYFFLKLTNYNICAHLANDFIGWRNVFISEIDNSITQYERQLVLLTTCQSKLLYCTLAFYVNFSEKHDAMHSGKHYQFMVTYVALGVHWVFNFFSNFLIHLLFCACPEQFLLECNFFRQYLWLYRVKTPGLCSVFKIIDPWTRAVYTPN